MLNVNPTNKPTNGISEETNNCIEMNNGKQYFEVEKNEGTASVLPLIESHPSATLEAPDGNSIIYSLAIGIFGALEILG